MLASMRSLSKSWAFKGLMVLLVISFGIWGIGDMFKGNPAAREVARVGKQVIKVQDLEAQFQMDLPQIRKDFGGEMTADQARKAGLYDRTLQVMIDEMALDQEAAREGIILGDDVVLQQIAALPQFRDKDGKFNTQLWHRVLGQNNMSERLFVDFQKRDMARKLILNAVARGAKPPKTLIDNLYMARGNKRILEVLSINNASMKGFDKPSDDELKSFYAEHEENFVAPEYRGLTVAQLSPDSIAAETKITDEDVKQAYEKRSGELAVPETRDLIQIVLQDETKAKEVASAAQKSGDLSKAAKDASLTPIAMNKIDDKSVLPELYTAVFGMDIGQISPPIKSDLGWHVVQLKKINEAGTPSLDNVRKELIEALKQERVGDAIAQAVNELDDAIAAGKPLEDIAETLKLHLTRFASIDQRGFSPDGKEVKDIPMKDRILPAAFAQNSGEIGQVIDDGKGNYFVVRTDNVTPSQARPFEEAKAKVLAAWTVEKQTEEAAKAAEEIAKAMREGKSATSFASRPGVDVRLSKPISLLGDVDRDLPPAAFQHVFVMKKGDVVPVAGVGKNYVLRMADIVPVSAKRPEASRQKVVDNLKETIPLDIMGLFLDYTKTVYPVRIDADLLNSLKNRASDAE